MSDHNRFSDRDTDSKGYYSNSHTDSYSNGYYHSNGHTDSYSNLCLVFAGCPSMSKGECVC